MKERIRFTIYEWQQRGGTAHQLAADIMRVIEPENTRLREALEATLAHLDANAYLSDIDLIFKNQTAAADTARKALRQALAKSGPWKPIERAPKDGTPVLAYGSYLYPGDADLTTYTKIIWFDDGRWHDDCEAFQEAVFSHFMHLPNPPEDNQ